MGYSTPAKALPFVLQRFLHASERLIKTSKEREGNGVGRKGK